MKLSTAIILSFTMLTTGCTIHQPKQADRVGPGTFYAKWQKEVMDACSDKAAEVVLKLTADKYKEGVLLTEHSIVSLIKNLTQKCYINSGIVI